MIPVSRSPLREGTADVLDAIRYVRNGLLDALKDTLAQNPEQVNEQDSKGLTALHWAASHRFYAAVIALLETGKADLNIGDCRGRSALDHAHSGGHQKIIEAIQKAST